MFERVFQWGLRHGARLLFGVAVAILVVGFAQVINAVAMSPRTRAITFFGRLWEGLSIDWTSALAYLLSALSTAALPFFCALVVQRADLWLLSGRSIAASGPAPAPGWVARHGARLLVALSLPYFAAAAVGLVDVLLQAITLHAMVLFQGAWLAPLWEGSMLVFAALALDRLDRWLATVRPTYSD